MEYDFNNTKLDVSGFLAVKFANGQTLDDFCAAHLAEYNRDRLRPWPSVFLWVTKR
jgi:hypothetical protein